MRQDKLREVRAGHDGTWVAHPGLVPVAKEVFDAYMPDPNQIGRDADEVRVTAADLLAVPDGEITREGLRWNIDVGLQYLAAWLRGNGCVPIYNLMEDAATAEICRAQVWQWVKHGARLKDGEPVTAELVKGTISEVAGTLFGQLGGAALTRATRMYEQMMTNGTFPEFLTLVAYDHID